MKRAVLFLILLQLALPALAATRVTVDQLSKEIAASRSERDGKVAGRLATLELSERLSALKLAAMQASLPGPESRRALVILADQATFLNPPQAEIPNQPAPSFAQQRDIIAKTIDYVKGMQLRLPNLFATRDTIHFEDSPMIPALETQNRVMVYPEPLHPISQTSVTVLYRDGQDFIQMQGKEQAASTVANRGLSAFGEFGPILTTVLIDLPHGKLAWGHWEQGASTPVAVFSFSVPQTASHYLVGFCCVEKQASQQFSGYHGEITIDPEKGTVQRLTLLADPGKDSAIRKADLMVEYGPVKLAGREYFCPTKSISVSLAPVQVPVSDSTRSMAVMSLGWNLPALGRTEVELQTMVNDVTFDHYHLFQSESRVLTAEDGTPLSTPASIENTASVPNSVTQFAADETLVPAVSVVSSTPATEEANSLAATAATPPPVAAAGASAAPEFRITPQQTPSLPDVATGEARFSMRVTTRIVEVSVAAFDKKGKPITELKREEFEISDGGRKQSLRSFGLATTSAAVPVSASAVQPVQYSNRVGTINDAAESTGTSPTESNTIIFFDSTSLQFSDLTHARDQVLRILATLPASEPIGLYVRVGFGFRVLLEATTDRTRLTAALQEWKPNARDLARAQEAEDRNRQQFDTLRNPKAVNSTYATVGGPAEGSMIDSDPQLFNLGEEPTRAALTVLVAVAAHMGAISGHKNLVWIASDNVLADWSDQSASGDEGRLGPNSIGAYSIRTQEALNNAHVSLYPFDASQLGTDATDASLQNAGVQLDASAESANPGFKTPPGGRTFTQLRTQTHAVQIALQQLAESTGGRAFGRSSNVVSNLNRVIEDSKAIYQLSFAPDTQPDDKYHQVKVTVPERRDVVLRYRTGYLYSKEPATLKERFAQVLWQPFDASEISLTAHRSPATGGAVVSLDIAAADVSLSQKGDHWTGKLDVFLVQRDETGAGALVKEQTLALDLSVMTHDRLLRDGIPFEQYLDSRQNGRDLRLIVVDENSGRIGSITLPAAIGSTTP